MSCDRNDPYEVELRKDVNPEPSHKQVFAEFPELTAQPEGLETQLVHSAACHAHTPVPEPPAKFLERFYDRPYRRPLRGHIRRQLTRPLRVMKFGGTSVGDASCIARVVEIVQMAARQSDLVVVVSAMSGVTNLLLAAAVHAGSGDYRSAEVILERLRNQHELAIQTLFSSLDARTTLLEKVDQVLEQGRGFCKTTSALRELTPASRDAIAGLGERLCAPLLAAALEERGVHSEAAEATRLIMTDSRHGAAEPQMDLTRELCQKTLRPLLQRGTVPVVTGYIGATVEGVATTLGRGGSDYSATIIGAALQADEVIIWTDVDGIFTTDPRMVGEARTIPELSYREASDLACFGAKVLHPKSLRPVERSHIPVSIRNTFAPGKAGTRINEFHPARNGQVKAITVKSDVSLISVRGQCAFNMPNALRRILPKAEPAPAEMILIAQSSSQDGIGFVVSSQIAGHTERALCNEFEQELAPKELEQIRADSSIAVLTLVGHSVENMAEVIDRTLNALERERVRVVALAQGSSACALSFVIRKEDVKTALHAAHAEFQLGANRNGASGGSAS